MKKHMPLRQAIRFAFEKGYRVSRKGILIGLKGRPLKLSLKGKQRYPLFPININGTIQSIGAHRLAAYCFYGERSLTPGIVVRHVKRRSVFDISKKNIKIGTHSQNNLDKPKRLRLRAARLARAAQPREGTTAKLTPKLVRQIRRFYRQFSGRKPPNGSVSALVRELGVGRNALACVKSGATWAYV